MNLLACTRIELLDLLGPTAVERHRVRWLWEIIDSTVRDAIEIGLIYEDENGRRYCDPERCEPGMYREMHTAIRVLAAQSREGWGPKPSFADRSSGRVRRTVTSLQAFVRVFAHRIEQPDYVQWCEYLAWLASRNEVRRVKK